MHRDARYLVAAPGREGSEWFVGDPQAGAFALEHAVDIGGRVELPAEVFQPITDIVYESKLLYYSRSFDDRVRHSGMNPNGFVVTENCSAV